MRSHCPLIDKACRLVDEWQLIIVWKARFDETADTVAIKERRQREILQELLDLRRSCSGSSCEELAVTCYVNRFSSTCGDDHGVAQHSGLDSHYSHGQGKR